MALITSGFGGDNTPPKPAQEGGPVKRYDVMVNGVQTTLLLSDRDAAERGLTPVADPAPETAADAPETDQPASEPGELEADAEDAPVVEDPETKAADAPANKARTAANKRAEAAARAFGGSESDAGPDAG